MIMSTTRMELSSMTKPLLDWYDENRRSMVWRDNPTPYNVWISEIMLQQTRIEAAKSYFIRFTDEIPDIQTLATIPEERLMKLWEGLGYYNRARNLQKAAQLIVEKYDGQMPAQYDLLLDLPGIGPYTAGAIASIAFGEKAAAVDGNVLRVLTRYLALDDDIMKMSFRKQASQALIQVMPERSGDFNQAIMELGEVVCIPNGAPLCECCPLASKCQARELGRQGDFPVKTEKKARRIEKRTVLIIECEDKVGICKRPETGLLAGLWEFPSLDGYITKQKCMQMTGALDGEQLEPVKHIFSHVEWHMRGVHLIIKDTSGMDEWIPNILWVQKKDLDEIYTLPVAFHGFKKQISK